MDDLVKSIKAVLYDRVSSPMYGTFILSWCYFNFRLIMVITSDMPVKEKFQFIDHKIIVNNFSYYLSEGFLYPFLLTAAVIFISPYPAKYVYSYWLKRKLELKKEKQKIENQELLSKEESYKLRRKYSELEIEFNTIMIRKDHDIEELKKTNAMIINENRDAQNIIHNMNEKIKSLTDIEANKLGDLPKLILQKISQSKNTSEDKILALPYDKYKIMHACQELLNKGFVGYDEFVHIFQLTQSGRDYLVKHLLIAE